MKRAAVFLLLITLTLNVSACSLFVPHNQTVSVTCNEPGVVIMVNGETQHCNSKIRMRRDRAINIQAVKPGYFPYSTLISTHMSTTGILDFVGALIWLVPAVGFVGPGAWSLDETSVNITMIPEQTMHTGSIAN